MEQHQFSQQKISHPVRTIPYTIENQKEKLKNWLTKGQTRAFSHIIGQCADRLEAIVTFLAILEAVQQTWILIVETEDDTANQFELMLLHHE